MHSMFVYIYISKAQTFSKQYIGIYVHVYIHIYIYLYLSISISIYISIYTAACKDFEPLIYISIYIYGVHCGKVLL